MRTFVAMTLPDDVRTTLRDALVDRPAGLRWSRPAQWHLTLAFLGDVETGPEDVAAAIGRLEGPLELTLTTPGRFTDRVLWLGLEGRPAGQLDHVAAQVRQGLHAAGLAFDDKPFRPHLTLARAARRGVSPQHVAWARDRVPQVSWRVDGVHVMHSHLGGDPARHEVVATTPI